MTQCSVEGCASSVLAKGLCNKHYQRMQRNGTTALASKTKSMCCECGERWAVYSSGKCRPCYRKERRDARPFVGVCLFCGEEFSSKRRYAPETGRGLYCCREHKEADYRADGRAAEVALRAYYRKRYGITPEQAQAMRKHGCAICGSPGKDGRWGTLHLDHNHQTNTLRGVLCADCNLGLGKFKDDPLLLEAAAAYIRAR